MIKKLGLAVLTIFLATALPATKAFCSSTLFSKEEISKISEMKGYIQANFMPTFEKDSPYTSVPNIQAPFVTGVLDKGFLLDGVKAINYVRYLAGLPHDVVMTDELNKKAQHGPLVMAANNQYSHTPSNAIGMPDSIFKIGYETTSSANIGRGYSSLYEFNTGCANDSDNSNIDRVGHRRWLLNPNLMYVGMGYVDKYTSTIVFDKGREPAIYPSYVAWPSKGLFPFDAGRMFDKNTAWSVTIGSEYNKPAYFINDKKRVVVTLARNNDGKQWVFNNQTKPGDKTYFNIDMQSYGYGPTIIFRPDIEEYKEGDSFTVKIENIQEDTVKPEYRTWYWVEFNGISEQAKQEAREKYLKYSNAGEDEKGIYGFQRSNEPNYK